MCNAKLSVLIPFLNEREEVITTVQEVRRTVGYNVEIVVVNDGSIDDYDYEGLLKPYKVNYFRNDKNLGSAPSRDICVKYCKTPYFLFLDAHMRFYDYNWHLSLIRLLSENDRRFLCAQTICLEKKEDGSVIKIEGQKVTFGAYMPLLKGSNLPDIKWNNIESMPNESMEPIPFMLGAAYAGSVRYWSYLRGMYGLKKYGCEEQFISIKTWLEGGTCVILKNFGVGHIYRKKSPYKHYAIEELYNYMYLSSLFFPSALKAKSYATLYSKHNNVYYEILHLFMKEKDSFVDNMRYFRKIFTKDIFMFLDMNKRIRCSLVLEELKNKISLIPTVADFVYMNISNEMSLLSGKIGQFLFLKMFQYYSKTKKFNQRINFIENDIKKYVLETRNNINCCCAGWCFLYLYEMNIIKSLPKKIMGIIDKSLIQICKKEVIDSNNTFEIKALLAYLTSRYRTYVRFERTEKFNLKLFVYIDEFVEKWKCIYSNNQEILNLIFMYEMYRKGDEDVDYISISDMLCFKTDFPKNPKYWGNTLSDSNVSTVLLLMISKLSKD